MPPYLTLTRFGQVKKALANWLDGYGDEAADLVAMCARANDLPHLVAGTMKVEKWIATNGEFTENDNERSHWQNECVRVSHPTTHPRSFCLSHQTLTVNACRRRRFRGPTTLRF